MRPTTPPSTRLPTSCTLPSSLPRFQGSMRSELFSSQRAIVILHETVSDSSTPVEHKAISTPPPPPPNCDPTRMMISDRTIVDSGDDDSYACNLSNVDGCCGFLPVSTDDVVAYEYVGSDHRWRWGLGTVVGLPEPRLVQLQLWHIDKELPLPSTGHCGSRDVSCLPGPSGSRSEALEVADSRAASSCPDHRHHMPSARWRLDHLREQDHCMRGAMGRLDKRLAAHRLTCGSCRQNLLDAATAAENSLSEVRARVKAVDSWEWREIRCYHNPPAIVHLVVEAVVTVLGERNCGSWSWAQLQRAMRSGNFPRVVEHFNPHQLSRSAKQHIRRKFIEDPRFTYDIAMKGSRALGYLQQWVIAQVEVAMAMECLAAYDGANGQVRMAIARLDQQVVALRSRLEWLTTEEERVRSVLTRGVREQNSDVRLVDYGAFTVDIAAKMSPGFDVISCGDSNDPEGTILSCPNRCEGYANGDDTSIVTMCTDDVSRTTLIANGTQSGAVVNGMSTSREPSDGLEETPAIWRCTHELLLALRTSVLCNYNRAKGDVIRLTREQVHTLEVAAGQRSCRSVGSLCDYEQRAVDRRRSRQATLDGHHEQHAQALRDLEKLETNEYGLMEELKRCEFDVDKLDQAVHDGISSLWTARGSQDMSINSVPRNVRLGGRGAVGASESMVSDASRRWRIPWRASCSTVSTPPASVAHSTAIAGFSSERKEEPRRSTQQSGQRDGRGLQRWGHHRTRWLTLSA